MEGYIKESYKFLRNFQLGMPSHYNRFFLKVLYENNQKDEMLEQYQRLANLSVIYWKAKKIKPYISPPLRLPDTELQFNLLFNNELEEKLISIDLGIIESNTHNLTVIIGYVKLLWNSGKLNENQRKKIIDYMQVGVHNHEEYTGSNIEKVKLVAKAILNHYSRQSDIDVMEIYYSDLNEKKKVLSELGLFDERSYGQLKERLRNPFLKKPPIEKEVLWAMLESKAPIINFITPRAKYTLDYVKELTPFTDAMKEKFGVEILIRQQNLNTSNHPSETIYKVYLWVIGREEMSEYTSQYWHDSEIIIKLFNEILSQNRISERWISLGFIDHNNLFILIKPEHYKLLNDKYGVRYDD